MFRKNKKCQKCSKRIPKGSNFCPFCGTSLKSKKLKDNSRDSDDWGMLGREDYLEEVEENPIRPSSILGNGFLDKMFGSAIKMLEKELQKNMRDMKNTNKVNEMKINKTNFPRTSLQLYVNGKRVDLGNNKGKKRRKSLKDSKKKRLSKIKNKKIKEAKLPKKQLKDFSKFSKTEPVTNIRRLSDRIVYEINLPGVDSKKQISISRLENSIEIKAVAKGKKKSYYKVIKVSLPIINYSLDKETLVLELAAK